MASIILTRLASEEHAAGELPRQSAWPISITASGVDMPSEIFVYHAGDYLQQGDVFEVVASPLQLQELPTETKQPGCPYYRRSRLDLLCRSAEEAEYVWLTVKEEVEFLVRDFNSSTNLLEQEQITFSNNV